MENLRTEYEIDQALWNEMMVLVIEAEELIDQGSQI